ncbi:MAG: pyruvate formate lyase family protein [Clostridium sp.]|nr:pyruvate formate lyase family protein [Clostridium sp.]
MARINIDGEQNVEVSRKLPSEKTQEEQLEIMESYTRAHRESRGLDRAQRELRCLKTIYPELFCRVKEGDLIAGRLDFLPIGFGCVTSIGGVGHYCVFHKLREFKELLESPEEKARVDALYDYWQQWDVKSIYCQDVLNDTTTGRFIDCDYPLMATARLSGMMLNYKKLMRLGVNGLIGQIQAQKPTPFLEAAKGTLELFKKVILRQQELVRSAMEGAGQVRREELRLMERDLEAIRENPPETFHQALQLFWLYALCAGAINYGRLDDALGGFLKRDLDQGRITQEEAYRYLKSLWLLIENRRTTVNGRIIVGGAGREDPEAADLFTRICLRVCKDTRYVEPQFTLRLYRDTPQDIRDMAYDCIAAGATYPTLYNDEVNIPAVEYGMRVDRRTAEQYVPFGCGEFVIQGKSVGTPNTLLNLLKLLNMAMNQGVDPMDGICKSGPVRLAAPEQYTDFQTFYGDYKRLLDYYFDLSVDAQYHSYEVMNQEACFLFTSILMDDCVGRGKALLDGGVEILGGTNETYGNINASDALYALKTLVFEQGKYTLEEVNRALLADFEGNEPMRRALWRAPKYGNDDEACDELANDLFEYVAKGIRQRGIDRGMGYYLIVISNNQTNTDWGHKTSASADGRKSSMFMNPANNPQGGAAKNGPTAGMKSLARFIA